MSKIRPEIEQDLVRKVKLAFPTTVMMDNGQTIEYAVQWALDEKEKQAKKVKT